MMHILKVKYSALHNQYSLMSLFVYQTTNCNMNQCIVYSFIGNVIGCESNGKFACGGIFVSFVPRPEYMIFIVVGRMVLFIIVSYHIEPGVGIDGPWRKMRLSS